MGPKPGAPVYLKHRAQLDRRISLQWDLSQQSSGLSFQQKLEKELNKFLSLRGSVDHKSNPLNWWRQHSTEYPLLSRYYRAHCAFPATSTNSERIYNIESLVVTSDRKKLLPGRVAGLCEARDYLLQRQQTSAFRLCKKCPQPPSPGASYIICCKKHNSWFYSVFVIVIISNLINIDGFLTEVTIDYSFIWWLVWGQTLKVKQDLV